ncbi:T9SS type B sorting domain-containing protein [Lishizhenia sp.]|uniref:T9SS type B sorting domain-containing protein n=1 Tax=Lishizhenia sp. TaxID=2497594 RepID=UPI00299E9322|nr:T9SS type B sorting domain-containing protein [Lishizhenia sp.]MDX1447068.1 gliding motility-associated C-terminal domain-containing protein [Lishizhenia sp.]
MKKSFFFLVIAQIFFSAFGQNLVPNPSFEEHDSCPQYLGDFFVKDWYSPTLGSPDYFNDCSTLEMGVPYNILGNQEASDGSAYVGFHLSDFSGTNVREYIQVKLNEQLIKDEFYTVSLNISLADSCDFACNNFAAYLSVDSLTSSDWLNLNVIPQINFNSQSIISEDSSWVLLIDTLLAQGGEKFLTIGVFANDISMDWMKIKDYNYFSAPYYFLDNVNVSLLSTCDEFKSDYPNVFTPNNDGKNDFWNPNGDISELEAIYVLNRWGNTVVKLSEENGFSWDGKDENKKVVCSGVYYIVEEREGCPLKNVGVIHLIK